MLEKELRANWDNVFYPEPEPEVETFGEEVQPVDDPVLLAAGPSTTMTDAGPGMGAGRPVDTIKAIDPTMRQQLADFLQAGFERLGASRNTARKNAQTLVGGGSSNLPIGMGLADIVPFLGTALQTEEAAIAGGQAVEAAKRGDLGEAGVQAGMAAIGMIPGAVGTVKGVRAASKGAKALAPKAGEMLDAYMQRTGMQANLIAYHGTPHQFDKFSASKIGTGEGAQAYGRGLYFAENRSVAGEYAMIDPAGGAIPSPIRTINGTEVQPGTGAYKAASLLDSMTLPQAKKLVSGWVESARPDEVEYLNEVANTLNGISSKSAVKSKAPGGVVFTVDIPDEMVAKMLDFDAPISSQSQEIQALAQQYNLQPEDLGGDLLAAAGGKTKAGAQLLKDAGIPGVRYFDQGSRGNQQGTRNIVVFPGGEDQVKILKREGQSK
jgi:hypothetical protein